MELMYMVWIMHSLGIFYSDHSILLLLLFLLLLTIYCKFENIVAAVLMFLPVC
jgi:hypothetical protein